MDAEEESGLVWLWHAFLPMLALVLLGCLVEYNNLDYRVAAIFYDVSSASFPAREAWWAENFLHRGGIWLIEGVAVVALVIWCASFVSERLAGYRRGAAYLLLCIALTTGLVAGLKRVSNVDCPWDLKDFGGDRPLVSFFADRPAQLPLGHCFPAGHSSGAFSLFAFYFLLRRRRPRAAWAALAGVSLLGLGYAATQWARGAHFPSHDLWSAAIAWAVSLGLDTVWLRPSPRAGSDRPNHRLQTSINAWLVSLPLLFLLTFAAGNAMADEPRLLREIAFEGNKITQEKTLLREIPLHEGDTLDTARIERCRQAVLDLGLFRSVQVREEPMDDGVRLVFVVEEKWYLLLYPRLSANSDGQNSFGIEARWNNLWGLNHNLRLIARSRDSGDEDRGRDQSYRLGYQAPSLFDSRYGLSANVAHSTVPVTDPAIYDEIVNDAELLLTRRLSDAGSASQGWMAGAGLLWREHSLEGPEAPAPFGTAIALVTELDYRDLRFKVFSEEGALFRTRYEIADQHAGSDYSYTRLTADYDQSIALGSLPHQTLEFGAHIGSANNGPGGVQDFSLGGNSGLRGYPRKSFEGDFYYLLNAQYLRPLHWDWLRLVVGIEAGNVYEEADYFNDRIYSSLNLGLRLRLPRWVNLEFEAGFALPLTGGGYRFYGDRGGF